MTRALILLLLLTGFIPGRQEVDPALRAVIESFFATQEAEDLDGYLALWSRTAQKPEAVQLRSIFDSGADKFTGLEVEHATVADASARVRVAISRERTTLNKNPDGTPQVFNTRLHLALAFVKEDGAWKLVREGAPADELAAALIVEEDPARRAAMLTAEADIVTTRVVDALGRSADSFAQRNLYQAAQAIYERALEVARLVHSRRHEGRMLQNIANGWYFRRDFPRALAFYEERLALERAEANDEGIASALVGIGTIKYSIGEYAAALPIYHEALSIQERMDDQSLIASTLLSTGNVLYLLGDFEGAIADYKRAETLKRKNYDLAGAGIALEGLARTYLAQGDLSGSLVTFMRVLGEARNQRNAPRQGSALLSIGDIHFRLGNLETARGAFEDGRRQFESIKDLANAGRLWQGTALVELVAARFPQAEAAYAASQTSCAAAQPDADEECVARALVGLAFAQAAQQHFDAAIASYRKSIGYFDGLKQVEPAARAQVGLAEALAGKKDHVQSLIEAGRARETAARIAKDDVLWRALVAQARAQRSLKRAADALASAQSAVAAVQHFAAETLQRPGDTTPRDTTSAFVTAAILQAEAGDARGAFETIELMRAHALRNALAANERDIAAGMTEEERADERTQAGVVRSLFGQYDRAKALAKPDQARIAKLEADVRSASAKRDESRQRLFARVPQLRAWRGLEPAATFDDIATLVKGDGDLLVEFVVDEHDLLILTAQKTPDAIVPRSYVVAVDRQTLAERVARAVDPATLAKADAWRTLSADVFKLLPAGAMEQITSSPVITIVPDDMLWRVPFEAMPIEAKYLADRARIRYAPSASAWVRAPAAEATSPLRTVIAAAPQVPAAVIETLHTTAPSWTPRAPDSADAEVACVVEAIGDSPVSTLAGAAATEPAVRAAAATASVLHIAAPFRINAASPFFSSALLSASDGPADHAPPTNDDGLFEAREAPTAGLSVRTVLFSDPSTMAMRDAAATVPIVDWLWRAGGAETAILRRWGSDDAAANELLAAFYRLLREGKSAGEAMASASAAARNAQPPAVWAGWMVLSGR